MTRSRKLAKPTEARAHMTAGCKEMCAPMAATLQMDKAVTAATVLFPLRSAPRHRASQKRGANNCAGRDNACALPIHLSSAW